MRPFLFFVFLICGFNTCFGQTGQLIGIVSDTNTKAPLELATISIFEQDSSLVTYQLSDKNGRFAFEKLPLQKKLRVTISYTSYRTSNTWIEPNGNKPDTLNVLLSLNSHDSDDVVVTAIMPIRMNGDTLELNPAAFKMAPGAVLEDVLAQAFTVWSDGTITVNGRKVQNYFVDGKPFLGSNDPRLATQNLPKDIVKAVQVYQEYDRSKMGQASMSGQGKPRDTVLTMNIKLKEDKKTGYFGKAGIGYGTDKHYEGDLVLQAYNKKSSGGIGGGINNINKSIAGLQELFQNNTYRNFNPNLYNVGRFGTDGINKNYSLGAVYTHNFLETSNSRQNNQITLNYNTSGSNTYITGQVRQTIATPDNPQLINSAEVQNSHNYRHEAGISYVKTNSYSDNLNLTGNAGFTDNNGRSVKDEEARSMAGNLQSANHVTGVQKGWSNNQGFGVNFSKSDYEEPLKKFNILLNANHGDNFSENDTRSTFRSFVNSSEDTTYNRRYTNHGNNLTISGNIDYGGFKRLLLGRYNLWGINLSLGQWFNYSNNINDVLVGDYDSLTGKYVANPGLSNHNKKEIREYTPSLFLSKEFQKWNDQYFRFFTISLRLLEDLKNDKNSSSFAYRNLNRSFQFFRQEASLAYQYSKREKYSYYTSLGYSKNFGYPTVDQLYTIVDSSLNVYNTRVGNPQLQNTTYHRLNLYASFNTENPKSPYTISGNINSNYTRSLLPVTDSIITDAGGSGKRTAYYINADKSNNLNLEYSLNFSRKIKKSSLQFRYDGNFNADSRPVYIDTTFSISRPQNISHQFTLQFSLRSLLILNLGQSLQINKTNQSASGLTIIKNTNNSRKIGLTLNYPANFSFSSTLETVNNAGISKPYDLWNAFAQYRFMKQQCELKFSAMDILKQNKNISTSANAFGATTRISNGLQQYFLLTFSYYPRKFGKTVIKPKTPTGENMVQVVDVVD